MYYCYHLYVIQAIRGLILHTRKFKTLVLSSSTFSHTFFCSNGTAKSYVRECISSAYWACHWRHKGTGNSISNKPEEESLGFLSQKPFWHNWHHFLRKTLTLPYLLSSFYSTLSLPFALWQRKWLKPSQQYVRFYQSYSKVLTFCLCPKK